MAQHRGQLRVQYLAQGHFDMGLQGFHNFHNFWNQLFAGKFAPFKWMKGMFKLYTNSYIFIRDAPKTRWILGFLTGFGFCRTLEFFHWTLLCCCYSLANFSFLISPTQHAFCSGMASEWWPKTLVFYCEHLLFNMLQFYTQESEQCKLDGHVLHLASHVHRCKLARVHNRQLPCRQIQNKSTSCDCSQ